jgi:hypothetical protein
MQGLIPESIRLRADKALGETYVAQAALSAGALELLGDLGTLRSLAKLDLVDPTPFATVMRGWLDAVHRGERTVPDSTDGATWTRIWPLLAFEAFLRQSYAQESSGRKHRADDGSADHPMIV